LLSPVARRFAVTLATALMLGIVGAFAGAVSASADPASAHTALRKSGPFELGPADSSGGSVAVERNGDLLVTYFSSNRTIVCLLHPGGRSCAHITRLKPPSGDDLFDVPQVFVPSPGHVAVLVNACCVVDDDLLYSSTNGGRTFSAPARVGTLDVSAATLIGRQIAFTAMDDNSGTQVESVAVNASGPPASIATPRQKTAYAAGIGQYSGGVLVGADYLGTSTTTTYVEYAPRGKNFDASSSYRKVATFTGEQLLAMSGDALLTVQVAHNNTAVLLRIFNGRGFGPAHVVPNTRGGGPEWFTLFAGPTGMVHVFSVRGLFRTYDMIEESTSTGRSWSKLRDLGSAIRNDFFNAGLNDSGRGIVLGTDPAWAYPVP
jgi:hypothetical protein